MAVKKTIRKITSREVMRKITSKAEADPETVVPPAPKSEVVKEEAEAPQRRRGCAYCLASKIPSYTDMATLKRFLSDRSKILPKSYSHLCSKHQRGATLHIKYARHLSLLPFTPKV